MEAICLKALAKQSERRYPTARAIVDDVQRWLDDEPVKAYDEPLHARLGRWSRKHRTTVSSGAVLMITAVIALAMSTVVVSRQKALTEAARARAHDNYVKAEQLRGLSQANFERAREAVDTMLTKLGAERLQNVPQVERTVRMNPLLE